MHPNPTDRNYVSPENRREMRMREAQYEMEQAIAQFRAAKERFRYWQNQGRV